MRKQMARLFFYAISLSCSVLFLILSLLCGIDTTAVNERAAGLEREISALKIENEILSAQYESRMSLEELERRAIEELGMQRCDPNQISYIELPG